METYGTKTAQLIGALLDVISGEPDATAIPALTFALCRVAAVTMHDRTPTDIKRIVCDMVDFLEKKMPEVFSPGSMTPDPPAFMH
jgi:hypothetical protein